MHVEQPWRDYLLRIARTFASANGIALATVSRRFHGTDSFFVDFELGQRTITLRKLESMLVEFQNNWPTDKMKFPSPPDSLKPRKLLRFGPD